MGSLDLAMRSWHSDARRRRAVQHEGEGIRETGTYCVKNIIDKEGYIIEPKQPNILP